jgi:glutamine amidotransferase
VDTGVANLGSVAAALARLRVSCEITQRAAALAGGTHVILPGVGAAGPGLRRLRTLGLECALRELCVPILGICLGMQMLFAGSAESDEPGLGLFEGAVQMLPAMPGIRVPHMGWNRLEPMRGSPLLQGLPHDAYVYFVHSYAAAVDDQCIAACTHGARFAAAVSRGNVHGVQFHPERSGAVGAQILRNFLAMRA